MRIWQLCTPRELYSTETGGAVATVVAALSRELVAQGHDVTVAARSDGTRRPETGAEFVSLGAIPWPSTPAAKLRWKAESALNRVFGGPGPATARAVFWEANCLANIATGVAKPIDSRSWRGPSSEKARW